MKIKAVLLLFLVIPCLVFAQSFDRGLEGLAKELAEKLNERKKNKIAVWGFFSESEKHRDLGNYLTEDFSIYLGNHATNFGVIDRSHLKTLLKEHRLIADGFIDERTTKRLGKLIAADAVIVGTYTVLNSEIKVRARVLDTETALQIGGASHLLSMDDNIARLLGKL
ncbi:FlgO family outer membrane protein [uncultured Croceitalea sp.]|uniref:FlgO family outer membrane protein n=1 Tax=uncultured Croceitalea sp. TaxID=1798908 RepID=UPI0033062FCC